MIRNFKVLAVVMARGGSKGVPKKNIRPLCGIPLIEYAFKGAKGSLYIDRTILSTDDPEIIEVGRAGGIEIPFVRPRELAGPSVKDLPVIVHALDFLRENEGYRPDIVVHLRPTAPLRTSAHIDQGIEILAESGFDSVRSVAPVSQHPWKMWQKEGDRLMPLMTGDKAIFESYNMPRQELPKAYIQNGSVDVAWRKTIEELGSMTGQRIGGFVMEPEESVNIDSEVDFLVAEYLMNQRLALMEGSTD